MLNQKGQAFDAFKLLIAAVVAGAILVILLSMINVVIPVNEPPQVMAQELTKVKKGGIASTSKNIVTFVSGVEIEADAIAAEAGLNKGAVVFCCGVSDDHCTGYEFDNLESGTDAFECGSNGDKITVLEEVNEISGKIRAYCPIGTGDCIIGFKEARS